MKKLILPLIALFGVFSSCGDTEIIAPMTGVWQCTGVNGQAAGIISTPTAESKYLNLLSVVYGGALGMNYYARTGSGDLLTDGANLASVIGDVSSGSGISGVTNSWQKFLTTGTFTYSGNSTSGTMVMTAKDGMVQEFVYNINGSTMTLTEKKLQVGGTAGTVIDVIGSLFGGSITSSVDIVYTYKKASISEITSLVGL